MTFSPPEIGASCGSLWPSAYHRSRLTSFHPSFSRAAEYGSTTRKDRRPKTNLGDLMPWGYSGGRESLAHREAIRETVDLAS